VRGRSARGGRREFAGRAAAAAAAAAATLLAAGCAPTAEVRPWEKGELARPSMTFDADRLEAKTLEKIYSSKEAASGGTGVGGGGCGCN
jgi:hypothetical protein